MAKFNEYTQKATPEDADTLMIYDAAAKANKLSPFSGIWTNAKYRRQEKTLLPAGLLGPVSFLSFRF